MKRKLLLIMIVSVCFLTSFQDSFAQTTVTVNASATWNGYANVFDLNNVYLFGSSWGLADIKSDFNTVANTVTLYPNYNTYNATDTYWANGAIGNKIFEGNTYVENAALAGQTVTFNGFCSSNTLNNAYQNFAFIKALDPNNGYATVVSVTAPLVGGSNFTVTANAIPSGLIVQYGFTVKGLNANPVAMAALGNVVVGPYQLGVASFESSKLRIYPNPTSGIFSIESENSDEIQNISVYNLLGQQVFSKTNYSSLSIIDLSQLQSGVYIVKAQVQNTIVTTRVIKE